MSSELNEVKEEIKEMKTIILSLKDELKGLVEIQQRLIHERLGAPTPLPPANNTDRINNKIITISKDLNSILLTGNTYAYNSIIKDAAKECNTTAQWNSSKKAWVLNEECLDNVIKKFIDSGLVRDTDFVIKHSS